MNTVAVEWQSSKTNLLWTEACAQIMEQFGLPGHRYTTEVDRDFMKFHFKDSKDAFMCRLLISEYQ